MPVSLLVLIGGVGVIDGNNVMFMHVYVAVVGAMVVVSDADCTDVIGRVVMCGGGVDVIVFGPCAGS